MKIYDNIIKYDSLIELSFILENEKLFKNNIIIRCSDRFEYIYKKEKRKYNPDFYNKKLDLYYELKDSNDYKINKKLIDIKLKSCEKSSLLPNRD